MVGTVSVPAGAAPARWDGFQTPSGNIHCMYLPAGDPGYPAFLRCDILSGVNPEPSGDCSFDWTGASVRRRGRAQWWCGSDTVANPDYPVLEYGRAWQRNGIRCVSRRSGLRCENTREHGFKLSRAESRRF